MDKQVTDGVSAAEMLNLTGVTYRQLYHWTTRGGILRPLQGGGGAGHPSRWAPEDVARVRCINALTKLGIDLQVAARIARDRDSDGWARVQLSPDVEIVVRPEAWESPGS